MPYKATGMDPGIGNCQPNHKAIGRQRRTLNPPRSGISNKLELRNENHISTKKIQRTKTECSKDVNDRVGIWEGGELVIRSGAERTFEKHSERKISRGSGHKKRYAKLFRAKPEQESRRHQTVIVSVIDSIDVDIDNKCWPKGRAVVSVCFPDQRSSHVICETMPSPLMMDQTRKIPIC